MFNREVTFLQQAKEITRDVQKHSCSAWSTQVAQNRLKCHLSEKVSTPFAAEVTMDQRSGWEGMGMTCTSQAKQTYLLQVQFVSVKLTITQLDAESNADLFFTGETRFHVTNYEVFELVN